MDFESCEEDIPLGHLGLKTSRGPSEDAVLKRVVYSGIGVAYYWEEP